MDYTNLEWWEKECNVCGIRFNLFQFNQKQTGKFRCNDTCRYCEKSEAKRKKMGSRYSINKYQTLNNGFMTDDEISKMYSKLRQHMLLKYGRWDEETIHRTILKGLKISNTYNPKRASKLVFFQTILWSLYMYEIDPKYNNTIRYHYSLDWTDNEGDENSDVIKEAVEKSETPDTFLEDNIEFLKSVITLKKYPHLYYKLTGASGRAIAEIINIPFSQYQAKLNQERAQFINEYKTELKDLFDSRRKLGRKKAAK